MELTYTRNGDYLIPNLALQPSTPQSLDKYARMWKAYLQEHQPLTWNRLILSEKL